MGFDEMGDVGEMVSQAGAHLSLKNTSIHGPHSHPHVSPLPPGFMPRRDYSQKAEREEDGRKWALL